MSKVSDAMDAIRNEIDAETRGLSRADYREFLEELEGEAQIRRSAMSEDDASEADDKI